ncbi:MAG TPA: methionyl-tRNA formyltransferase [Sandaracinaceae bacterium LLY-WYZ-13_1]|nr:methionyl-tRNA formyltransferase [Sandaracinaceae bacterium LLY-WYZ-13_1]
MRAIFFGTPQLAVPCLEAVHELGEVVRVICQPDRPAGRGMKLRPPPVKVRAEALGLEVAQPRKVKTEAFAASLRELEADVAVVVAYGRILPRAVLDAPRRGCVNVHASLLPRWRGAGPIQWAIVHGDAETGVCLMRMDAGMDTGPVIACERTAIAPDETAGALGRRLSAMGAGLLRETLPAWVEGRVEAVPQDDAGATYAPLLQKEDGRLDWRQSAQAVHDRVRGLSPWPGAFTEVAGKTVKIHRTAVREATGEHGSAGEVIAVGDDGVEVACGRGKVALLELQLQGKKRLPAGAFVTGHRWTPGLRLGDEGGAV